MKFLNLNTAITMQKVLLKEEKEKKQLMLNLEREIDFQKR